jgi:hypothetical protein
MSEDSQKVIEASRMIIAALDLETYILAMAGNIKAAKVTAQLAQNLQDATTEYAVAVCLRDLN